MSTLYDVAEMLKEARAESRLSQHALASRAGVSRSTVARMETLAKGDMSVSALVRLLEAAGYDLKLVKPAMSEQSRTSWLSSDLGWTRPLQMRVFQGPDLRKVGGYK